MQALLDFFPVIAFGVFYFIYGIYAATAAAMVTSGIQVAIHWFRFRKFEKIQTITFIMIIVLGSATLLLHKSIFIKWKPSVIYWLFAVVLLGSHLMSPQPLMQKLLHQKIKLKDVIWKRLNVIWAVFFTFMGFLNIYMAYNYSTKVWVYFKVIGTLGLTILFIFAQALYLAKHVQEDDKEKLAKP
ncbi:MAG: septation protein A [Coxiellaceae bacterium]|nr:septation protein A [Coxiellaceae bacterium]